MKSVAKTVAPVLMAACWALGLVTPPPAVAQTECIAPADPGGGWDFTCRAVGRLLYELELIPNPLRVINMPGGVGAVAYSTVASKRAAEQDLIVATSTVGTTQIAQGKYPGGPDLMRWVAMVGTDVGVILVDERSPFESLSMLVDALKKDPTAVVTAGSSGVGGWDHIRLLLIAQAAGMAGDDLRRIRWVQYDGGGPAVTQMMGGHVDVVATDLGEISGFIDSGDVRVLAVMSDDRLPEPFTQLPTATEQGFAVSGYNWRGFYTGGEVSDAAYQALVSQLKALFDSEEWRTTARANGLVPLWRGGAEFEAFVRTSIDQMAAISREVGIIP
ncbi:MAG: Bug family tripartite tricarboxylate transporter substrate binding protein [Candidatus Competibacterales bacterium]